MIFFIREKAPRILGETFRPCAKRHNVAIHPYFHVLCVISLSVSYGSMGLFSGTESVNLIMSQPDCRQAFLVPLIIQLD